MCTRFQQYLAAEGEEIAWMEEVIGSQFGIEELPADFKPQANIAKTDPALVVTNSAPHVAEMMGFSLFPSHAAGAAIEMGGFHNARSEKVDTQKFFTKSFAGQRCLVPATAFYDWKKIMEGDKIKDRIPFGFSVKDQQVFYMAGIWDEWINHKTQKNEGTFAVLTCEPNELVKQFHHRMPVILLEESYEAWLRPAVEEKDKTSLAQLKALLQIFPGDRMVAVEYDRYVSTTKNKDNAKVRPMSEVPPQGQTTLF